MQKLRLELCETCCFDCVFCHHDQIPPYNEENRLNASDYGFLCKVGKMCGFESVQLSGGEPLMRSDINEILENIKKSKTRISVTTNGYLLDKLKNKNILDCVNVSIHSLNLSDNEKITNKKYALPKVIDNIQMLKKESPRTKIKINMVSLRSVNINNTNLYQVLNFCAENKFTLKIIELFDENDKEFISISEIENILINFGFYKTKTIPSKVFLTNGRVDVILQKCFCNFAKTEKSPTKVCNKYNDLFVLSNGQIQLCRHSNNKVDLFDIIKQRDVDGLISALNYCKKMLGSECKFQK